MESEKVINQWNNAAKSYSENQRTSPNNITNWQILKELLGDVKNKIVLDAGCGDGCFSNQLKNLGAKVFACDGSKGLLKIAQNDFPEISFKQCNLTQNLPYQDASFDIVVSSLVLMDIDNVDKFFSESARVLKSGGRLIFSITHPCFFPAEWERDQNNERLYKKIKDYWNLSKETLEIWGETTHYHRPITWYSNLLKKYGFLIEQIQESPEDKDVFEQMQPHQKKLPLFICFSCLKRA